MVAIQLTMTAVTPSAAALAFAEACKAAVAAARELCPRLTQDQAYAIIAEQFDAHGLARPGAKGKAKAKTKPMNAMTDAEFVEWLESQDVYRGIDVRREIGKCQVWLGGAKATRKRIVNWLNKADRQVGYDGRGQSSFVRQPAAVIEPEGWQAWINANLPESALAVGGASYPAMWQSLDASTRAHIEKMMRE